METVFDRDTALERTGPDSFSGHVHKRWWIVRGPNGGYLAAMLLRALMDRVDDDVRTPRSLTIHYTRPPAEDAVAVETSVEREGRSVSTLTARMTQDGRLIALALASFSVPWTGTEFDETVMPDVPAPEELEPNPDRPEMPFVTNFDFRWALGRTPLGQGGKAESGAWMRLREPRVADHALAAQFMDAWIPAVFSKVVAPSGVPTIDLTMHFRSQLPLEGARPDDWYLGVFRTTLARQGFIEEDGELWSRDGRLLVQSRQLALIMG